MTFKCAFTIVSILSLLFVEPGLAQFGSKQGASVGGGKADDSGTAEVGGPSMGGMTGMGMQGGVPMEPGVQQPIGVGANGLPIYGQPGMGNDPQNPQTIDRRRQQPSRLSTVGPNCPFRPDDTQVVELWATAREALQGMEARNQACKNALTSLTAGIDSTEGDRPQVDEVRFINEGRERDLQAQIITLSATPDPANANALAEAQENLRRLQTDMANAARSRNANSDAQAQEMTISRLRAVLRSIPAVQQQCHGADANIAAAATQTGLNLFASASPLIFGAGTSIGAIASLLGSLVGALVGPSGAERGLQYMTRVEDFNNLACFYFQTQRV
ncbi:MAG: hypothetical protein V4760_12480, partial [Bdellovibrionota bacterium]